MKTIAIILSFFFSIGLASAQSEEKVETKPTKAELPAKAEKGTEISEMVTTSESGKEKGISISSAARKGTLMREKSAIGAEKAEEGKNRGGLGAANSERGKEISNQARTRGQVRPDVPGQATRPTITVPQARPTPPVVRPTPPERPTRPVTPPSGRPGGI